MQEATLDSRTAAFGRKRTYQSVDDGHQSNGEESISTTSPRDAKKLRASLNASDGLSSIANEQLDGVAQSPSHRCQTSKSSGLAPAINWNTASKATIRTTLTGSRPSVTLGQARPVPATLEPTPRVNVPEASEPSRAASLSTAASLTPETDQSPGEIDMKREAQLEVQSLDESEHFYSDPEPGEAYEKLEDQHNDAGDSTSDGGVMINLQDQGFSEEHESGEISEDSRPELNQALEFQNVAKAIEEPNSEQGTSQQGAKSYRIDDKGDDHNEIDAVMEYSASKQVPDVEEKLHGTDTVKQQLQPRFLADLDLEDLKLQLRYFYISQTNRDPKLVDLNLPVRCLVCGKAGHTSEYCKTLTCATCGVYKEHFTQNCPRTRKCEKCSERGHGSATCPYKIPRLTTSKLECDLCQRIGHIEDECELLWRTSGRTWESDLPTFTIRLYCYECGNSGHLGNECPSRNPRKPLGSSTWSARASKTTSTIAPVGISIRGRAESHRPIEIIDDSEDDRANFYRRRVPPPARSGHIRVAASTFSPPNNGSFRAFDTVPSRTETYHMPRPVPYTAGDHSQGRTHPDHYQPQPRRRSRSPVRARYDQRDAKRFPMDETYMDRDVRYRGYDGGGDSPPPPVQTQQQPPLPIGKPPGKKGKKMKKGAANTSKANFYRPLPSAAQQAWKKGRT